MQDELQGEMLITRLKHCISTPQLLLEKTYMGEHRCVEMILRNVMGFYLNMIINYDCESMRERGREK